MSIECVSLSRSFGEDLALEDFSLLVEAGEVHAIVGLNGAGKTTLMRLLLGMLSPDSGSSRVLGVDVDEAGPRVWSKVGHLIGAPLAYPQLTVRENLSAAGRLHGINREELGGSIETWIERLELSRWADRRSRTLSSGNRQRLGIAAAIMHQPSVIILDEPSTALDPAGVVLIRNIMAEAAANGAAILVSSHHLDELARTADQITIVHRGRSAGSLEPQGRDLERQFFESIYRMDVEGLA